MKAADGTKIAEDEMKASLLKLVGDTVCQVCFRPNPAWFTPNATWNAVVRPPTGVFCPLCFIEFAATNGVDPTAWVLLTEDEYERTSASEERERVLREALDDAGRWLSVWEPSPQPAAHRARAVLDAALATPAPEQPTDPKGKQ